MCEQGDTVVLRLDAKTIDVDRCIAELVSALNFGGTATVASCCGHGKRPGNIALADGRELVICQDFATARTAEKAFPPLNAPGDGETK